MLTWHSMRVAKEGILCVWTSNSTPTKQWHIPQTPEVERINIDINLIYILSHQTAPCLVILGN